MGWALKNDIYIGSVSAPSYHFRNNKLVLNSPKGIFSLDTIGNELSIDTFSFVVRYNPNAALAYSPKGKDAYRGRDGKIYILRRGSSVPPKDYLRDVAFGTPCWWYVSDAKFSKGYVKTIERISKFAWKITCVSGIGLLAETDHAGGLYNGTKFSVVFADIVGDAFPFSIAAEVGNTPVYGWLPSDKARNNLHRLLFATGASMLRGTGNNDYNVSFLSLSSVAVPDSRVAINGGVTMQTPATEAVITEHGFAQLSSTEVTTLFDNTTGGASTADHLRVIFSEPMHSLSVSGLTLHSSGVNFAVVSGTGTLTGKAYVHSRSLVTQGNTSETDAKRIVSVTDNCLISVVNSINVAQRVLAYYSSARTVKAKIVLDGEKPGQNLSITDAFGDATTAFLTKMEVLVTSVKGATCELIEDYVPSGGGNNFTHRDLITASGTWTAAAAGMVRIVMTGGADGGSGGYDGHNGWGNYPGNPVVDGQLSGYETPEGEYEPGHDYAVKAYYYGGRQKSEEGGAAGSPGQSGKLLILTRYVEEGEVLTFNIGVGGNGGAHNGASGAAGTATTVSSSAGWSFSTANGARSEIGYYDAMGNITIGLPGAAGHEGGAGGQTDSTETTNGNSGAAGLPGSSVGIYSGGRGGAGALVDAGGIPPREGGPASFHAGINDTASGGGGGGAAWGAAGGAGGAAEVHDELLESNLRSFWIRGGRGGDGANAVAPARAFYGCGGSGGNGGGSGGNNGGAVSFGYYLSAGNLFMAQPLINVRPETPGGYIPTTDPYGGGKAGAGSAGGAGGNGCAIVYS